MRSPLKTDVTRADSNITDDYSMEVSAKDIPALTDMAPRMARGATISTPYLANQDDEDRKCLRLPNQPLHP
jgi:methylenetetrahydrofolate reductase (NADPH)